MMKKILAVMVLLLFAGVGVVSAGVGDDVFWIELWYEATHENPDDINDVEYVFAFEAETDVSIDRIEFITPAGYTYQIPNEPDSWDDVNQVSTSWEDLGGSYEWDLWATNDSYAELDAKFGDGLYTFTFYYVGGGSAQTTVNFLEPGTSNPISQPMQVPEFINPQFRDSVTSPVTVSWELCTDANVNSIWVEVENESADLYHEGDVPKSQTSWVTPSLVDGYWDAEVCFDMFYNYYNPDGIEIWMGKSRFAVTSFTAGVQWIAYEVWGGDTDYTTYPEWWEYYHNIDNFDYVKLGESVNGEAISVGGDYTYYAIVSHEPVFVDAVQGSTGSYYSNGWATGGTDDWDNMSGTPDGVYGRVGDLGFGGSYCGFARLTNPGDWNGITVITQTTCSAPIVGDVNGDCMVNFADFALMAGNWMECNRVPEENCWQ